MNSDSNLKRFIVLLDKAPFVLFLESANYLQRADHLIPALKTFNLSFADVLTTVPIKPDQDLRKIISATNTLEDVHAYNIIEALADALPNNSIYFPVHFFMLSTWQNCIEWQNVDYKPEPKPVDYFTIAVSKLTHELSIIDEVNVALDEDNCDGVIHLESLDINVPFPLALLKECTMEIHDIIVRMSVDRITADKTKSKYLSVMHTGHDTFNYVSLRRIEKDLRVILNGAGITIEE